MHQILHILAMPIHIWFILIYLGKYREQIFSVNAEELSTLMPVNSIAKFNFHSHFGII